MHAPRICEKAELLSGSLELIVKTKAKTIGSLEGAVMPCAGEVVDDAESKRRMAEAKASGEHNFYMMEMAPGLIIDARTK